MARLGHGSARKGYTLIEMLVATTLTLVMMGAVATVFGMIGEGISAARATLEMSDAMRATAQRLRTDLEGVTQTVGPPHFGEWSDGEGAANEGYFEYIEGPLGPVTAPGSYAVTDTGAADTTVADTDDILLFTTRTRGEPFIGRVNGNATESQDAEVAWFVRGRTLYRRVLLVRPDLNSTDGSGFYCLAGVASAGFYNLYDLSARLERDASNNLKVVANSLADLTRRESRYAHHYRLTGGDDTYPFNAGRWGQLGLPTLGECSHANWAVDGMNPATIVAGVTFPSPNVMDFWINTPFSTWGGVEPGTGELTAFPGARAGEDVVLSNVIGFDVKAWDPLAPVVQDGAGTLLLPGDQNYSTTLTAVAYGAYVDLGYATGYVDGLGNPRSAFCKVNDDPNTGAPGPRSNLPPSVTGPRVYDTWSLHYENDGVKQVGNVSGLVTDAGTNGFDDDGDGVVDGWSEQETQAPYPVPLRGIQIKLRVFEPDSRQIREMTIVHSFLPE